MKAYHIIDKRESDSTLSLIYYTVEDLKNQFEPNQEEMPEEYDRWLKVRDVEDLKEYLESIYYGCEVPYDFEEHDVKSVQELERANGFYKKSY